MATDTMDGVLLKPELDGLTHVSSGKVREMFAIGDDLLLVATDRLSAFDIVFREGIPDKARVLTGLSDFWLDRLQAAAPHHRISSDVDEIVAWRRVVQRRCSEVPGNDGHGATQRAEVEQPASNMEDNRARPPRAEGTQRERCQPGSDREVHEQRVQVRQLEESGKQPTHDSAPAS